MKIITPKLIQNVIASLQQSRSAADLIPAANDLKVLANLAERASTVGMFDHLAHLLGDAFPSDAKIRFREASADNDRYGVHFEVRSGGQKLTKRLLEIFGADEDSLNDADDGVCKFENEDKWFGEISLRDLADAITISGEGEFFDVTYSITDLRAKRAEFEETLKFQGLHLDKAA
jgi:hypothetical protein